MSTEAPYGAWSSPITAAKVVEAAAGLSEVRVDPVTGSIWWSEGRPEEGGRVALVRLGPDGTRTEPLPAEWSARTRVHEYGGGAWWINADTVWFASWADQRIWRIDPGATEPTAITPEPPVAAGWRYADGVLSPDGAWIVCVRESHCGPDGTSLEEARTEVVAIPSDGAAEPVVLASGSDFVAAPRINPTGDRLAWLSWDHPHMPWDGTELWVADLDLAAPVPTVSEVTLAAGGPYESLVQPEWSPDGDLLVTSDRSDWWNLYLVGPDGLTPLAPVEAEVSTPLWVFGQSRYVLVDGHRVVMALASGGMDHLATVIDGEVVELDTPYTAISSLRAVPGGVVAVAASPTSEPAIVRFTIDGTTVSTEILRAPRDLGLPSAAISVPRSISFPTTGGRTAHGLYYPPTNPDHTAPNGELPPLLVTIHGGPTSAARPQLNLGTQFWTSRGIAVVDVNYGGSTGYGRPFRRQLDGQWGVVDVDDCIAAAQYLADEGLVDPDRLLIRGGSAGGFTTLAALAFRDTFAAGASHYGIADLAALAQDTHKFESRYLDGLVGPYPEQEAVYRERSPIHHLDGFDRPLIVFQGLEDEIVPPNQAEAIVEALTTKGVPVAYVPFEGEQHGFRQSANIMRALEGELWFYGQVLGFEPADDIEPVPIENL